MSTQVDQAHALAAKHGRSEPYGMRFYTDRRLKDRESGELSARGRLVQSADELGVKPEHYALVMAMTSPQLGLLGAGEEDRQAGVSER
jgi:hypothetical protein